MDPELVEAKIEAEALSQVYQQAYGNMHQQQQALDVQKQIVQEAQKHKEDIQKKLRAAILRLRQVMEQEQRKSQLAKLS